MAFFNESLLAQLRITEFEIARRKELLGFTRTDEDLLASCHELVTEHIDSIVNVFYEKQTAVEEIALLIGDGDTLARLHTAQRAYVLSLFDGLYDVEYVNDRLRVGIVHKRIGVEPKLYLSAVKTLKETLDAALFAHIDDQAHCARVVRALDKLLYFDTTLIFDTYIRALVSEVQLAKDKAQTYARELEIKVADRTRQLLELSQRDTLTGLYNRRAFGDYMRRELVVAKRHRRPFSLAYFDVDQFKEINDRQGHYAGDEVLRMVGEAMQKACRDIDFPCRYGGDEFCLALPDCLLTHAKLICERLIEQFTTRIVDVSLSIGIVQTGPTEFLGSDELIRKADAKMYEAKLHPGFKICT